MNGTAILCSGQGLQSRGMFDLVAGEPGAEPVFKAASAALNGRDPRELVMSASEGELHGDKLAQILCCTQALAVWSVLDELIARPAVVAGYSVGELAAWAVAGMMDAATLFALAAARADAMDEATTQPAGLLSIRGLSRRDVDAICEARHTHIAIIDGSETFLIGGTDVSLMAAARDADARGARYTTRLAVAVPSHTPLLQTATKAFRAVLRERVPRVKPRHDIRLLSGIDGNAVFSEAGLDKLAEQISRTVNWVACMDACRESGVTKAIDFGPGAALAHFMREHVPDLEAHGVSEFHSLDGLKHWLSS
jgi:[acyl-carrier-protein] S-malonyltransferase